MKKIILISLNELVKVTAGACRHKQVQDFNFHDLTTTVYSIHQLTGISYGGVQ